MLRTIRTPGSLRSGLANVIPESVANIARMCTLFRLRENTLFQQDWMIVSAASAPMMLNALNRRRLRKVRIQMIMTLRAIPFTQVAPICSVAAVFELRLPSVGDRGHHLPGQP